MSDEARSDRDVLHDLARWLRKHDCMAFDVYSDAGEDEQDRATVLITWLADSVDVLNVPPRATQVGGGQ